MENLSSPEQISDYLIKLAEEAYQQKEKELEAKNIRQIEKFVSLRSIDTLWMDHLDNMDHLRDSVRLRAYGQKDPLVEYKNEGIRLFQKLLATIQSTVVNTISKVALAPANETVIASEVARGDRARQSRGKHKLGRNDPCPCGKTNPQTGKPMKYKKCCYPKFGR